MTTERLPDLSAGDLMQLAERRLNEEGNGGRWLVHAQLNDQPSVALLWGDGSATLIRDDGTWVRHGLDHPNELQRRLMVTRLRFLADTIENPPEDQP